MAEGGKIETRRDSVIAVVPRGETQGNGGFAIDTQAQTVSAPNNGVIQSYGQQTDFNSITVFTNNNITATSLSYVVGGVYIASNGTTLSKLRINSSGNYTTATHSQANNCNTI